MKAALQNRLNSRKFPPGVTRAVYRNGRLPAAFAGFRIVHLSDLHNTRFGMRQGALLERVCAEHPDAVFITGDLIDRRRFDPRPAMELIEGATKLAPVYYVPGNHEALCGRYEEIGAFLADAGVTVLADRSCEIVRHGFAIRILGLRDPCFYPPGEAEKEMQKLLCAWKEKDVFSILLTHRPELFSLYRGCGVDLAFAGHAHGGQFRLPLVGGLYAPNQGIFPKYTAGSSTEGGTTLFVSRGLGNSLFPVRLFNPPEIVSVTLEAEK